MYLCIYLNINIHNMIFVKINIYYYYYINNEETNSNAISTW